MYKALVINAAGSVAETHRAELPAPLSANFVSVALYW